MVLIKIFFTGPAIVLSIFMLSFIFVIMWSFWVEAESVEIFFNRLFISVLPSEIHLSRGEDCDPFIKRGGLWSIYQEGRIVIQLSRGVGLWSIYQEGRIVIQLSRGVGLWSIYQEGRIVIHLSKEDCDPKIQLSRGEDCDPFIKRGGLWSIYQEGRIVIQLSRGEDCDPVFKRGGLWSI